MVIGGWGVSNTSFLLHYLSFAQHSGQNQKYFIFPEGRSVCNIHFVKSTHTVQMVVMGTQLRFQAKNRFQTWPLPLHREQFIAGDHVCDFLLDFPYLWMKLWDHCEPANQLVTWSQTNISSSVVFFQAALWLESNCTCNPTYCCSTANKAMLITINGYMNEKTKGTLQLYSNVTFMKVFFLCFF